MKYFRTGNQIVDRLGEVNFSGNITPQIWYQTILTDSGKPYYLAIAILSDIVYWYRPTEIRDENTGHVIGWGKKIQGNMLQRNYEHFAKMYGESKKTITRAITRLENLGVIKRVFKTISLQNGSTLNNVLFLDLDVDKLIALTYPETEDVPGGKETPGPEETERVPGSVEAEHMAEAMKAQKDMETHGSGKVGQDGGTYRGRDMAELEEAARPIVPDVREESHPVSDRDSSAPVEGVSTPVDKFVETCGQARESLWTNPSTPMDKSVHPYGQTCLDPLPKSVQTNTKNTTETTTEIVNLSHPSICGGIKEQDGNADRYEMDRWMKYVRGRVEYDILVQDYSAKRVNELVDLIVETLVVKRKYVTIGGTDYPWEIVKNRMVRLDSSCLRYVLDSLENVKGKIKNIRAYMLAALYNAPGTIEHYYQNAVKSDLGYCD